MSCNAYLGRAVRLWKTKDKLMGTNRPYNIGSNSCTQRNTTVGMKQVLLKAACWRGRKRAKWVDDIHTELRDKFDRLRRDGVKYNMSTLRLLAISIFDNEINQSYGKRLIDAHSGKLQRYLIGCR